MKTTQAVIGNQLWLLSRIRCKQEQISQNSDCTYNKKSPRLHLFDQKYSKNGNIVKYFYNLK